MKTFFFLFMLSSVWLLHPAISHPVEPLMLDESGGAGFDILPIKPLEPVTRSSFSYYILFSATIAITSIFFIILRKKRKKLPAIQKHSTLISPYLEAMAAMNQLEKERYCENEKLKSGYFALSKILRTYISRSFAIPARYLTTKEIMPLLENEADKGWRNAARFMEVMEVAKFSNFTSSDKEYNALIKKMKKFIIKTRCETVEKR